MSLFSYAMCSSNYKLKRQYLIRNTTNASILSVSIKSLFLMLTLPICREYRIDSF